ncbi:hypothetical protein RF11_13720 [Thelohanellus kitauei]|uniref:Uncharacterized protein n=1 Tax=Thelohanellus kitauei TaxID=669202 RepID=A0A0C2MTS8_THEKT|nr:hypothetical protein RF11_13720 [Thelohanellus kitauei]
MDFAEIIQEFILNVKRATSTEVDEMTIGVEWLKKFEESIIVALIILITRTKVLILTLKQTFIDICSIKRVLREEFSYEPEDLRSEKIALIFMRELIIECKSWIDTDSEATKSLSVQCVTMTCRDIIVIYQ